MSYRRHVGALLRRNFLYRRRSWLGSIIQLIAPVAMISILLSIKEVLKDDATFKPRTIKAVIPKESIKPFSFLDYITAVQTPRTCVPMPLEIRLQDSNFLFRPYSISGINPENWPVPFLKCDFRKCQRQGEDASDYCSVNILAVAPAEEGVMERVEKFQDYINMTYPQINNMNIPYDMVRVFQSAQEIDDYVTSPDYGDINVDKPKIAVAVLLGGSGKNYEYTIRANSTNFNSLEFSGRPVVPTHPDTSRILRSNARRAQDACPLEGGTPKIGQMQERCSVQYIYNGALTIQRLVDDFIIYDTGVRDQGYFVSENGVSFVDFPSKEFITDGFYAQVSAYVPLLVVLGLLYPVAAIIRFIVSEKEMRQKELMKMMSVTESAIELSWFLSSFAFFFISGIFCTIASAALYPKASAAMLFIFWQLGFLSIVIFAMTIASVFSKTTRATVVGILVFFAGYFLTLSSSYDTGSRGVISLVSLHPVAALTYGIQIIGSLEDAGVGVVRSTYNITDNPSGYTFANSVGSMFVASFFWGFMMWYLNRVIPGDFGQPLAWNFMFKKSYWCSGIASNSEVDDAWETNENYAGIPIETVGPTFKEQERAGSGVHIRGLTKVFGEKTAVDTLSLSMYNGQVFSLLGHNGAGKTTTISMLTGMVASSEGYAIINGKDIRTDMQKIREDIGVCLQHDCLFPMLTVKEHLRFFSRVKGLYEKNSYNEAEQQVDISIKDVALFEKRNTYSKDLSGGMKRKLSLAIAFCGGSKVVFLDEPTSGMDTFSRRFIWDVIRQNREDRCIVLTTHFMDEADLLGDRIAIMAEGNLRCVGSSLFLKKHYGVGYHITIEKSKGSQEESGEIATIIHRAAPRASILSNISSELTFQLPLEAADMFPEMFNELDRKIEDGSIDTYGVGITTLDEVFLLVARGEASEQSHFQSSFRDIAKDVFDDRANTSSTWIPQESMSASEVFATHVRSLFKKRALNFKRDKKAWVCSTILPVLFALFGFLTVIFIAPNRNMQALELKISDLNEGSDAGTPFLINKGSTFTCQPAKCIASYEGKVSQSVFYNDTSYCGRTIEIPNASESQCTDVLFDGIEDAITGSDLFPILIQASDIEKVSIQLPLNPTENDFSETQYGAFFVTHTPNSTIESSNDSYKASVESLCELRRLESFGDFNCSNFGGVGYIVSSNFTALHSPLLFQSVADELLIREVLDDNDYTVKTTVHPLPITKNESGYSQAQNSFSAWFYLVLSFPFIASSFGSFIVQERMSKSKHLQTVAGVKPAAYWLSSYAWDVMNYQIPLWLVVILMYSFGIDAFTTSESGVQSGTIVILILYGPAVAGFTYITTFMFKSPSACSMFTIVFNFFIGLTGSLVSLILRTIHAVQVVNGNPGNLKLIAQIIEWILRFVPSFNFAKGLLFCINIDIFKLIQGDSRINVWDTEVMGIEITFLALQCVLYVTLAIYIDILSTRPSTARLLYRKHVATSVDEEDEDVDVTAEATRVLIGNADSDTIIMKELKKQYPNGKVAVDGVSIGVPGGQCFGLLGINGAGKTTIMGMLTAEFPPTSGDALLAGYSVTKQPEETRRRIGYCPQFDAHFTNMTGREHVELYGAIKGIPKHLILDAAASKLAEVGLSEFDSDRLSSNYSGGMKRKLSVACATIGNPQIVFLDEPSTGK